MVIEGLALDAVIYVEVDRERLFCQVKTKNTQIYSACPMMSTKGLSSSGQLSLPFLIHQLLHLLCFSSQLRLSVLMVLLHFFVHRFLSFVIFSLQCASFHHLYCVEKMSLSQHNPPILSLFPSNSSFTVSLEQQQGVRGDR